MTFEGTRVVVSRRVRSVSALYIDMELCVCHAFGGESGGCKIFVSRVRGL